MFTCKIITRTGAVFEGQASSVLLPGQAGQMEILDGHVPILTILDTGIIRVIDGSKPDYFSISKGLASLVNNVLTIFSDATEKAEDLNIERVNSSKERSLKRLEQYKETPFSSEYKRATFALKRAENRLALIAISKDIIKK